MGYVTLTLEAYPEGDAFVSRCRELGVTSCGASLGEAIDSVKDATTTYLNALEQLGERDRVFRRRRITVHKTRPRIVRGAAKLPRNGITGKVVVSVPAAA